MRFNNIYSSVLDEIKSKNTQGYDILLDENVTIDKIAWFADEFSKSVLNEYFSDADVDEVYINKPVKTGYQDKFKFNTENNKIFYTTVTYHKTDIIVNQIEANMLANMSVGVQNVDCLNGYLTHLKKYRDKYVAHFEFENFENIKKLTNNVGNYSYSVFGGVVRSVRQSLRHGNYDKINSVYFAIDKVEEKRKTIYDKIISDEMHRLKNKCIDNVSNYNNILLYYW